MSIAVPLAGAWAGRPFGKFAQEIDERHLFGRATGGFEQARAANQHANITSNALPRDFQPVIASSVFEAAGKTCSRKVSLGAPYGQITEDEAGREGGTCTW